MFSKNTKRSILQPFIPVPSTEKAAVLAGEEKRRRKGRGGDAKRGKGERE